MAGGRAGPRTAWRPGPFASTSDKTWRDLTLFTTGDTIYHRSHGIGTVQSIEKKNILGTEATFASLDFKEKGLKLTVRVQDLEGQVRNPLDEEGAKGVLDYLESWDGKLSGQWKVRRRNNDERLSSGDPYRLCEIIKGLTVLSQNRRLSSNDQRQLDGSLELLSQELSHALGEEPDRAASRIKAICFQGPVAA